MIDKSNIIPAILERLENLPVGHYLDMRTYKRNRCLLLVKTDEEVFLVIENGFFRERFENVPAKKLRKLLKTLLKREFPRSTKIRVYSMGIFEEESALNLERKVL